MSREGVAARAFGLLPERRESLLRLMNLPFGLANPRLRRSPCAVEAVGLR